MDRFDIVAVCLGKKTSDWGEFFFAKSSDLEHSSKYPNKLDVMHRIPLPESVASSSESGQDYGSWFTDLKELLSSMRGEANE